VAAVPIASQSRIKKKITAVNPEDLQNMTHYQQNMPPAFGCHSSAVNYLRVLCRHLNSRQLLQAIKLECAVLKLVAAL
jgi:hypothetical protein